ncbi:MAG: putative repeat protein (TIGR01451 family) [Neolewinella sp.]|jgi:extracellular elastinolytic metalloproteinase
MKTKLTSLLLLLLLGATASLSAQTEGKIALDYLQKEYAVFGLEATDIDDLRVTDSYASPSGTRHIYVVQQLHGLSILNAQASLHFRGDKLVYRTSDLATGLAAVPSPAPAFSAQTAIGNAVNAVTVAFGNPVAAGTDGKDGLFSWPAASPEPIRVRTAYYATKAGLRLAYRVVIDRHAADSDIWYVVVDAENGNVLEQRNQVLKCDFGTPNHQHNYDNASTNVTPKALPVSEQIFESAVAEESRYNVFRFGVESPIHGVRTQENSPSDPVASPFGWHDINGQEGPEFTITRGNNTYSYPDTDGDNVAETDIVADGGDSLVFDFFFADEVPNDVIDTILPAAMVQTFYFTNMMHDWLFHAGFDERAGNFQRNNYTGDGLDRDEVRVEVQDGSGTNNANFSTPSDGSSGTMQMFLWTSGASSMQVTTPETIAGPYTTGTAQFGPVIGSTAITGQVVISDPALGCTEITNDLTGKIALVTRGECNFSLKAFNAQEAGAVGVIICNDAMAGEDRGGLINMSDGNPELTVTIPSVFLTFEDCVNLRNTVEAGDSVSVTFQFTPPPPRDGDFDNGIVAHEMGHGVSNRLVGGPSNASCLGNDEQMGEGWSDFFTLASTPQTIVNAPDGTEARGIGNYATRRGVNGAGIRNLPYSTDFTVNNHTFDDVIISGTAPHPLGEVWATMLWDLWWAMTDEYGYDEDLINGTGGNNQAVQLVIEGMKLTSCRPGFVDGRDGILAADMDVNEGANQCLIWEVFSRRGVGFSARQGGSDSRTDGREAFDLSPACLETMALVKTVDENTINAGEGVTYSIAVINYREGETENVVVTDIVPDGMIVDAGSVRGTDDFTIDGQTITFNIGSMDFEREELIRYSVSSDPAIGSTRSYYDGAEDGDDDWFALSLNDNTIPDAPVELFWEQTDTTPFLGDLAYYVINAATTQDQVLQCAEAFAITGEQPVMRFFTKYDTEAGWDAGIVEVSTDETNWVRVEDKLVRGNYRGKVSPNASADLLNTDSFWGNSGDEPDANNRDYREIIIDLSGYAGQDVFIRYRFISDAAVSGTGWWIDEIEMLDAKNYESTATLTSDAGDNITAEVGNYGVLVLNAIVNDVNDLALGETKVRVFPNPAEGFVTVNVTTERAGSAIVQLLTIDGRVLRNKQLSLVAGGGRTTINTADLPAGMYVVQVTGTNRVSTTKVTIN